MYELYIPDEDYFSDDSTVYPIIPEHIIKGEQFIKLIDICFEVATYFTFSLATWTKCTNSELEKELEPFIVGRIREHNWFCYYYPSDSDYYIDGIIYKANIDSKKILLNYIADIFLHDKINDKLEEGTHTLEDLCIFTDDSLLLGTVTHERICHVYPPNEHIESLILETGQWMEREDVAKEQINIHNLL